MTLTDLSEQENRQEWRTGEGEERKDAARGHYCYETLILGISGQISILPLVDLSL